jgi:phytoene desaturase
MFGHTMRSNTAIIIGSGVGGMATAIRLASQGFDVKVFEKNPAPGGKLYAFTNNGYHFDAGPSLFTQPENIRELFDLAGEPIDKYFNYQPVDIACTYFYENGKTVNAYTDAGRFAAELGQQVNEDPNNVTRYLKRSEKIYENIGKVFLNHSLHKTKTWMHKRTFKALAAIRLPYLFRSLHQHNKTKFTSPEAVQLFNRFATYNGSSPYRTPAMLSLIPHLEQNQGTYYPAGGMISITHALYQLALAKGVRFYFDTPVQRIIHHEGKVRGVVVNDENREAGIVVSNADVYFTYRNLLGDPHHAQRLLKQERSSSAVIFYWGVRKVFPQLQLHNIFFSRDYKNEFDHIFRLKNTFGDPTVYINITSKLDPSHAPAGRENWFVMVNVPSNEGQNWEALKEKLRADVILKLNRMLNTDMNDWIETEQVLDPLQIEAQTASYKGSLYGTSSNSKMAAFLRHPNFTGNTRGLYFCGGSVHPGGGIPLCLKSAKIVSELILQDQSYNT